MRLFVCLSACQYVSLSIRTEGAFVRLSLRRPARTFLSQQFTRACLPDTPSDATSLHFHRANETWLIIVHVLLPTPLTLTPFYLPSTILPVPVLNPLYLYRIFSLCQSSAASLAGIDVHAHQVAGMTFSHVLLHVV